ncbi:hypothetical protein GIB67_034076 [Kingdonia uniflora]|uniref:Helicase C-terminal domain-containing protein n=1 Tax=Kingdonia uniflora TaxID=39325 RepID=A0A7J7M679_9MAGN|nr:hypothetical protein GIB67_034076 [Kingdonia uniflora]
MPSSRTSMHAIPKENKHSEGTEIDIFESKRAVYSKTEARRFVKGKSAPLSMKSRVVLSDYSLVGTGPQARKPRLKRCEPEFLVSTPDRLSELISANAIDLSGVSLLVIDGSEAFVKDGLLDRIRLIRQTLCGDVMTVIFPGSFGSDSTSAVQNMLEGPVCRLSLSNSIPSQSACISQCVHVSSSEEMIRKGMQILNKKCGKQLHDKPRKMLFVAGTISKSQTLATSLSADRYVVSKDAFCDTISEDNSNERVLVVVTDTEDAGQRADMGEFDVIMIFDFPSSIDSYVKILTRMARRTVYGVLHSFFSEENAQLAGSLIEVLEQCGQTVPEKLRKYRSKLEA